MTTVWFSDMSPSWFDVWSEKGTLKKRDCVINVCLFCFPKCFLKLYETRLCYWHVCNFIANKKFSSISEGSNSQDYLSLQREVYSTLFWFSSTNFVLWVHSQCMNCMTFYRTLGRFLSLDQSQNQVCLLVEVGGRLVWSSFQLEITFFL